MRLIIPATKDFDDPERRRREDDWTGNIDDVVIGPLSDARWLRENDWSGIDDLVIGPLIDAMSSDEVVRICALLETLHKRCDELKSLQKVLYIGFGWQEILEAAASFARNCPTVQFVTWTMKRLSLSEKVVQACCASHVNRVKLVYGHFNKGAIGFLCKGLCARNEPLHELTIDGGSFDRDAMDTFVHALPGMRLETLILSLRASGDVTHVQEDYQRLFTGLAECLHIRKVALSMTAVQQHTSFDEPVFSTILEAIPRMVSLRELSWYGPVKLTKEQWFRMGKMASKCPHMTTFQVHEASDQAEADAFLDGCGPHPRLLRIHLGSKSSCLARTRRWQTLRAQYLTVLLVGRSIERAGARSSVYRVPIDIFRRLHSFLPEG